jgi:2-keto-4-pentenoate hydratase
MNSLDNSPNHHNDSTLQQLARRQLADYDRGEPGTAFADGPRLSIADAYRVQSLVTKLREQRGESVIGYKVGCTSSAIRQRMGIDHPVFGRLFDSDRWPSGASLPITQFDGLAIEGELAVRVSRELSAQDASDADLSSAIAAVFPVIELHNFAFRRGEPSADELIANNAIHAGFICPMDVSPPFDSDPATLRIDIDDEPAAIVSGPELTRTIVDSLSWIAKELGTLGHGLQAGQTILCGSLADLIPVSSVCRISVSTDRFGSVEGTIRERT